ncbi:uncharacterized protein LOC135393523 [Ornithodoros turicata]|uniref:uncharacterized protein LOC135393523 n=1 Tax=Ornithodoros turicata TaxID=34597 RepID=UPI003138F5AB
MCSIVASIGLMAEVDILFHSRNPFFILRQFFWVTIRRLQTARNGILAAIVYYLHFIMHILFVTKDIGIVFVMTFLMRDIDEVYHGLAALTTFAKFILAGRQQSLPIFKYLLFVFHYSLMGHREDIILKRKHMFLLDVAYHTFQLGAMMRALPFVSPLAIATLLYHTYILWIFFRWLRLTVPVVKSVLGENGGGALSPAMSRLILALLEAQGGEIPLLRAMERYLRLQEQVRNLTRQLQEHIRRGRDEARQPDQLAEIARRHLD